MPYTDLNLTERLLMDYIWSAERYPAQSTGAIIINNPVFHLTAVADIGTLQRPIAVVSQETSKSGGAGYSNLHWPDQKNFIQFILRTNDSSNEGNFPFSRDLKTQKRIFQIHATSDIMGPVKFLGHVFPSKDAEPDAEPAARRPNEQWRRHSSCNEGEVQELSGQYFERRTTCQSY